MLALENQTVEQQVRSTTFTHLIFRLPPTVTTILSFFLFSFFLLFIISNCNAVGALRNEKYYGQICNANLS